MDLISSTIDDTQIITASGKRIDAAVAIQFKDKMRELTREPPARVILDLEQVDFVDSSGLGAIVAVMKYLGPDVKLELAALSLAVGKVFRLTRMDSIFTIHENARSAASNTPQAG